MPHQLDASGNPILRHGRPSPRTQGVTEEGETFQKFGTQQLKYLDPVKPALGVTQINTGQTFKGFTTLPVQTIKQFTGWQTSTPFSQQFQSGTTGALIKPPTQPQPNGNGKECDLGCMLTGRGRDCGCTEQKLAEPCTTCDSDKCGNCNAWDLVCEDCNKKNGTCTPPTTPPPCDMGCWITGRGCECGDDDDECGFWDVGCKVGSWWDKYGIYVMIIGGLIGLGFVLWLLRPLFSMIGAFKGGAV